MKERFYAVTHLFFSLSITAFGDALDVGLKIVGIISTIMIIVYYFWKIKNERKRFLATETLNKNDSE